MSDTVCMPLKNKKWLFPETGKAGFHFADVSGAVAGLKQDLKRSYTGLHEEELISWVEKWFPDATEQEQGTRMKRQNTEREAVTHKMEEDNQLTITVFR